MQSATALNIEDELSLFIRGAPALSPAQKSVAANLSASLATTDVSVFRAAPGMGRTTVLQALHAQEGGVFIIGRRLANLSTKRAPGAVEETFLNVLNGTLNHRPLVFVDDFHLLTETMSNLVAVTPEALDGAARKGRKFVFAVAGEKSLRLVLPHAIVWEMDNLEPKDYSCIARHYLGREALRLDMKKVHRFAPALTVHQIKDACLWLGLRYAAPDTDSLLGYLASRNLLNA